MQLQSIWGYKTQAETGEGLPYPHNHTISKKKRIALTTKTQFEKEFVALWL